MRVGDGTCINETISCTLPFSLTPWRCWYQLPSFFLTSSRNINDEEEEELSCCDCVCDDDDDEEEDEEDEDPPFTSPHLSNISISALSKARNRMPFTTSSKMS